MSRLVVISGCSSGGKSTLLTVLARRGFPVVEEPGRRVVREELASGGPALPWTDDLAFARRVFAIALTELRAANSDGEWTFFDRGLVDAAVALGYLTGEPVDVPELRAYHRQVFLTPPWRQIYVTDAERCHPFEEATAEYERLVVGYRALGYTVTVLPQIDVQDRADFVLTTLCPFAG
ncbi:MAG TPA: AAA family ATPase [Jatrophihabitans sp.]|nr:AAA family ATPase [Jatrophihabitans sp.]